MAFHLRESVLMDLGGISGPHMPRSRERRTGHQERARVDHACHTRKENPVDET